MHFRVDGRPGVLVLAALLAASLGAPLVGCHHEHQPPPQETTTVVAPQPPPPAEPAGESVGPEDPGEGYAYREPPKVVVEVQTQSPGEGWHWVPGYWSWRAREWRWVKGHWHKIPPHRTVWISGGWEYRRENARWEWRGGHWE
jgi:hypothetical protein